jgi:hypothetical protein
VAPSGVQCPIEFVVVMWLFTLGNRSSCCGHLVRLVRSEQLDVVSEAAPLTTECFVTVRLTFHSGCEVVQAQRPHLASFVRCKEHENIWAI